MQSAAQPASEIEYSEEEALLAQSANEFLAEQHDLLTVRRLMASESGYDADLYRRMASLGWLGLAVPESYGGAGLPVGALSSLCEPMGRMLVASPFLASTLAAQALLSAGSDEQKAQWLPRLLRGDAIGSVALSEPSGSYELLDPRVEAVATGNGFTLRGQKTLVIDAQQAAFVIASVKRSGKPALLLIERASLQGRMRREVIIDETRRSSRITLDGLELEQSALMSGGDAEEALRHLARVGWLLLSAEMAGGAEGVMQLTLEYLKTRKQFGKLIGSYQALKHPMVEIMCSIEQGRSLLYHAATVFDRPGTAREIALRMAKAQLGATYTHAADRAIQFHGAIGFTHECHAQLFLRRAQWAEHTFGDGLHHRRHLANLLWPAR